MALIRTVHRPRRRRPTYRRRIRRRRIARRVPRPVALGVSKYRYAKLSYCDLCTGTVNVGSYIAFPYQSSLYDPYVPVGGHQPMFFDQYAAMYQRYTVMGIAYSIDVNTDQSAAGPLFITVVPSSASTTPGSISVARERPGTKETTVSLGFRGKLKGYVSVSKILGVDRRKLLTDDQYSALISANPDQMANLIFIAWNSSGTASIPVYMSIRLTYYCRFFDPTEPTQS